MSTQRVIALLGRKDEPTDAVEDYCRYLGAALDSHDVRLEILRFPWEKIGWKQAFAQLEKSATTWRGQWILVQYTALAWSARGFPRKFPAVLKVLSSAGARVAVVFHDVQSFPGSRSIDRLRSIVQLQTMRRTLTLVDTAVFTVPPEKLSWLEVVPSHAVFIPVGPNLPIPQEEVRSASNTIPTIGVFSITGGEAGARETKLIISAVTQATERLDRVRLLVFGRHAELREGELRSGLQHCPVELSVEGVVDPVHVVQKLSACDVLIFVRGPISSRRSSAIAGIACGLPVIAVCGSETATPVTEAGLILLPNEDPRLVAKALIQVLSDSVLRRELADRSRSAYRQHFCWPAIAAQFTKILSST